MIILLCFVQFFTSLVALAEPQEIAKYDFEAPIIAKAMKLYGPVIKDRAGELVIERDFLSEAEEPVATRERDSRYRIVLPRGLLHAERLQADGLRYALCHAFGVLLGGAPRTKLPPKWRGARATDGFSLLSAEGAADYYAGLACFRRLVSGENHGLALASLSVSTRLAKRCDEVWPPARSDAALICRRAALGALNALTLGRSYPISLDVSDSRTVKKTIIDPPLRKQCRLDSAFAGVLCTKDAPFIFDEKNPELQGCLSPPGVRPGCWFKGSVD